MKRTKWIIAVAVVGAGLALGAYAIAADGTGQTYTGCLKNGKLDSFAAGNAPLAPCSGGATQVQLGNGDVTAVAAGPGLTGGGVGGDVTVSADTSILQARVNGDCTSNRLGTTDASISAIHADGTVTCNPDDAGTAEVISGFADGPTYIPCCDTLEPLRLLALPAGKYAIMVTLDVDSGANLGRTGVRCELRAGADFDRSDIDLGGALGGPPVTERVALTVVHEFTEASAAVVSCQVDAQTAARWSFLKITAVRVTSLSNTPLSQP